VIASCRELEHKRHDLPYDTDGHCIKVTPSRSRQRLGARRGAALGCSPTRSGGTCLTRSGPGGTVARKFGETSARRVGSSTRRSVWPARTVSRASMHNASVVTQLDVAHRRHRRVEKGRRHPARRERWWSSPYGQREEDRVAARLPLCGGGAVEKAETRAQRSYGYYCENTPSCPAHLTKRSGFSPAENRMDSEGLFEEVPSNSSIPTRQILDQPLTAYKKHSRARRFSRQRKPRTLL